MANTSSFEEDGMTEFLDIKGGRIAYDVTGEGPLIVLSHGIGDRRQAYRFLVPELVRAGYRVAAADMRGHGESSMGDWKSISRTDVAGDLIALIRHLGGPAVIVGHSLSGGAATIAAATEPDLVRGVVELGPFTRKVQYDLGGLLRIRRYRRGTLLLGGVVALHSLKDWLRYLNLAYPGRRPADYDAYLTGLRAKLTEPGRMAEFLKTFKTSPADAGDALPRISCPALVIMGTEDPDWADPQGEAEGIVAAMPAGLGRIAMIEGAGHYPHAPTPDEGARPTVSFLPDR